MKKFLAILLSSLLMAQPLWAAERAMLVDQDGRELGTSGNPVYVSGGSGAPTDADYLVGTANGTLSAEIVVGTSPGGELGGTWGSPTLDDNVTVTGWALGTSTATSITSTNTGATTWTGNQQMGEDSGQIVLDAALSADGKYSGITESGTAGAPLAFGDLVYLAVVDSRWELADASAASTSGGKIGICVLAAAGDGSATTILLYGKVNAATAFPALTVGAAAYISETAGDIVTAQPITTDAVIRVVGFANTVDELYFCPSPDYVTHT